METMEKHYTPEQQTYLRERHVEVGEDRIREVETEWHELFAAFRCEMDFGVDPESERMLELARKALSMVAEFTGGNAGFERPLKNMKRETPEVLKSKGFGLYDELGAFYNQAITAARLADGSQ